MSVKWFDIQQNTFTRWCNDYLADRGLRINDLKTDLKDGIMLINLLEIISGKKLPKHNLHPRINVQKIENLSIAIKFIQNEGLPLVNISAEDIHEGNLRIILGLLWTLILRYEIKGNRDEIGGVDDLLKWVQSKIPEYNITNWTKDWNDGRAVCALVNALRPNLCKEHKTMDAKDALANATYGIDVADREMGVDKLIFPEEMVHPKVDKLAMMTYIAQFRNLKDTTDAQRCCAYGPGLKEGIVGHPAVFVVEVPSDVKDPNINVVVAGPATDAKVEMKARPGGHVFDVVYHPVEKGAHQVHVKLFDDHIQGSVFSVPVLQEESLGGEGKIRVFYSTTSGSEKSRADFRDLQNMLQAKKVHLREDFEPWIPLDLMENEDKKAVFRKAGTNKLPIVFIDDQYVGDYDKMVELNETGKLDSALNMRRAHLLTEEEHLERLKNIAADPKDRKDQPPPPPSHAPVAPEASAAAAVTGNATPAAPGGPKFCPQCGTPSAGSKFCGSCGANLQS